MCSKNCNGVCLKKTKNKTIKEAGVGPFLKKDWLLTIPCIPCKNVNNWCGRWEARIGHLANNFYSLGYKKQFTVIKNEIEREDHKRLPRNDCLSRFQCSSLQLQQLIDNSGNAVSQIHDPLKQKKTILNGATQKFIFIHSLHSCKQKYTNFRAA